MINVYFPQKERLWVKLLKRFLLISGIGGAIFLMFWQLPPRTAVVQQNLENLKPVSVDRS